jgi:UDP-N-acetylbacillosamine N-acetyltransferase
LSWKKKMDKQNQKIVIWGASGHALVVADIIRVSKTYQIIGYLDNIDPQRHHTIFNGKEILGGEEQLAILAEKGINHIIIGFGNCDARLKLAEIARSKGFQLATAIHPGAIIAPDVTIGLGTVVAAGAVINPGTVIGENVIINTSASVDHECVVQDGAHICPGVHLAGKVTVGRGSWVGIGSSVSDHLSIGKGCMIGAGSVVVRDIPDHVVAYGNPARVKRKLEE